MKYLKYILLMLMINNPINAADIKVNFSDSNMFGINMEKIQFDNIILGLPVYKQVENSLANIEEFTDITYAMSYREMSYSTSFKICRYNSGRLYLLPQLTPEEPYCNVAEGLDLSNSYGFS
ncbi:MAG TPA: hypothetical protein ENK59_08155, partial [Thioploca sp.]|nr:hypothetical protein [Thioploca sp.]